MRIAAEVPEDLFGAAEGTLGIDDPVGLVEASSSTTGRPVGQIVAKGAVANGFLEGGEELAAKEGPEDAHGKEEIWLGGDPAASVERQPTTGDEAMGVRVKLELPSPGVQDGRDPRLDLGAEPLGIASQGRDGSGGGLEQDVEHYGWALAAKLAQIGRQREDQVKVWYRQNAVEAGLDPSGLREGLALGAVAISTRVVGRPLESAGR